MKTFLFFFAAIFSSLLFCGCSPVAVYEGSFPVMSTVCEVKIISSDREKAASVAGDVKALLKKIESDLNFYDPESRISVINREAPYGFVALTADEQALVRRSLQMSVLTGGAFDITFFPVWEVWKKTAKKQRIPTNREISEAVANTGYRKIVLSKDGKKIKFASKKISINLGGIAKEYALIKCAGLLKERGMSNALVSLGGDILALGKGNGSGWKIGIQDPFDPEEIRKTVVVEDKLVLTSGVYQRYVEIGGKKYHHIIDARTGHPADDLASVTIIKDIDSTIPISSIAVFLMEKKRSAEYLKKHPSIGYFIIGRDGSVLQR